MVALAPVVADLAAVALDTVEVVAVVAVALAAVQATAKQMASAPGATSNAPHALSTYPVSKVNEVLK